MITKSCLDRKYPPCTRMSGRALAPGDPKAGGGRRRGPGLLDDAGIQDGQGQAARMMPEWALEDLLTMDLARLPR